MEQTAIFGTEKISRVLFRLAPPVMLAQLIQALYNIVDSLFVGRYSESGLTALSIIYPIQLLMIALAVGTGVGMNALLSRSLGEKNQEAANRAAAVETADKLRNCTVKITAKGGANGKLFGAITGKEISEALMAQFGLDVGKQKIVLDEPIKAFGSYEIRAKLGYEVSGKFTVTVAEE